ncbi:MAG: potassium channel protein [Planctomycetota bacterium]
MSKRDSSGVLLFLGLATIVVLTGTAGYMITEGWDPWKSLFFTLITLTTVGFSDYGLSVTGERFTAVLMVLGIATVTFCVGQASRRLLSSALQPERRMREKAMKLDDHFILCGYGRIGRGVAAYLRSEGHQVLIMDSDEDALERARRDGFIAIDADATNDEDLYAAGLTHARGIAAITKDDNTNILITLSARAVAPDVTIIARAEEEQSIIKLERAGSTRVISLTGQGAKTAAELLAHPDVCGRLADVESEGVRLMQLSVSDSSELIGMSLEQCGAKHPQLAIVGVKSGTTPVKVRPPASTRLQQGDQLIVVGMPDGLSDLAAAA